MIRLKREGLLKGIKLEHISGDLTCSLGNPQGRNLWDCEISVMAVITDSKNDVVFPANSFKIKKYKVLGFDPSTSQILVLTNYAYPSFLVKGQQLRVWYTEDLKGYSISNNDGTHSIKVYVQF